MKLPESQPQFGFFLVTRQPTRKVLTRGGRATAVSTTLLVGAGAVSRGPPASLYNPYGSPARQRCEPSPPLLPRGRDPTALSPAPRDRL